MDKILNIRGSFRNKMSKILNSINYYRKHHPFQFVLLGFSYLALFLVIFLFCADIIGIISYFFTASPSITIDKPNTKIEYFTHSGVKEKEFSENKVTVQFKDANRPGYRLNLRGSFDNLPLSSAPVIISNGLKNYADIYAQNNLDFCSGKNDFLPVEFYKTFKSSWKDTNNTAVFVYAAQGKPIACFEGSHVNVSATASKKVKEIHIDGHKAIILNSKYSIYKVGQLKDMHTRKIKIKKEMRPTNNLNNLS
ncbi:DUF5052 family protein [Lactobacillus apis]|uniref:Uncharacterized protein n=1 Tax=Lactobacillus apis TaxID=303541 RepID=A0A0F4LN01_9LACO|nr:DUF5052 family protein [Lactobacillus apis]KJY59688.1 hypothetical protein JF72_15260 [Lactobacillus apis]